MKTLNIEGIDIRDVSDEDVTALNKLWVEVEQESLPDDPPRPPAEAIAWNRCNTSYEREVYWLTRDSDGRVIAYSNLNWEEKEENRHLAYVNVQVTGGRRGQGLSKALLRPAVAKAKELDRSLLHTWLVPTPANDGFPQHMGAKHAQTDYHNRLFIEELDRSLLDEWIDRAAERASDYRLEFWDGRTKEEDLEEFVEMMHIMNTAPRPESEEAAKHTPETVREYEEGRLGAGFELWRMVARRKDTGEMGGYTAMWPNPWRPEFAAQEDTGVLKAHQNRGLGRWLKAAMLKKLLEERPQTRWIDTGNATTNKPMLSINNALGFRPVETWETWEIPTADLEARLTESGS